MENKRLQYRATGGTLFLLFLQNFFLTVITAGIYTFWAKTNLQKYMSENTEWAGESFSFHGTGKERFKGFLKALVIVVAGFVIYYMVQFVLNYVFTFLNAPFLSQIFGYILMGSIFIGIIPLIVIGNRRYMTSRTGYRNLRFGFDGKIKELSKIYLKGIFLTIITLGVYYPWFFCEKESYLRNNTRYGNTHFAFQGDSAEIFFLYLKGFLLTLISLGIYSSWFIADIQNYLWDHTSFQGKKFQSDITGGLILGNIILSYLILIFSFGLGFAWVIVRMTRIFLETISLEADIDFSLITAKADFGASATTEGIESITDAFESFLG